VPVRNFWFSLTSGPYLAEKLLQAEEKITLLEYELQNNSSPVLPGASVENSINARAIMIQERGFSRTLLINKGSKDGLFIGAPVIANKSVFVGKIINLDENFASVLLVTDSSAAIAASLGTEPEIQAIVRGMQGLSLYMELIPQDTEIKAGDIVVTSILEENTPKGLLLGTVSTVHYIEGQLFKEATLSPFISLPSLSEVSVIIPK